MNFIVNAFRGFCMALADSVPGVSGGTIAFILGFYDKFINSLDKLVYGKKKDKIEAFKFLIKLGIGWLIGMGSAIVILTKLFESNIYEVSSLFLGMIILSIPLIIKTEKDCLKGKYYNIIFLIIGIVIVSLITYFNPMSGSENVIDITHINIGLGIYIFIAGMVAISAMVLPGISGSTLLLIFGLYVPIMTSIKSLMKFDFNYLPVVLIFGIGIIVGVISIIKLVKVCLEKFRSQTIYLIIGLMIGSLYAIVMGPTTLEVPKEHLNFDTFSILFFIIGILIIFGLEQIKKILEKKKIDK